MNWDSFLKALACSVVCQKCRDHCASESMLCVSHADLRFDFLCRRHWMHLVTWWLYFFPWEELVLHGMWRCYMWWSARVSRRAYRWSFAARKFVGHSLTACCCCIGFKGFAIVWPRAMNLCSQRCLSELFFRNSCAYVLETLWALCVCCYDSYM